MLCRALITEQLPPRKQQLYQTYGPDGPTPLIPAAQPAAVALALGRTSSQGNQQFFEIVNPNTFAVDVSSWSVSGDVKMILENGARPFEHSWY